MKDLELTKSGRKKMEEDLQEVHDSLAWEKNGGRILQVGLLISIVVPTLLTFGEWLLEYATRPPMNPEPADLSGRLALVTGGCGAMGLELAIQLAEAGAGVIIGCHGVAGSQDSMNKAEKRLRQLGLLQGMEDERLSREEEAALKALNERNPDHAWVDVLPLNLESFENVREFARKVQGKFKSLDMLVHNAASKTGCNRTEDGHEWAIQVNYLSPFLLTRMMLPILREGSARVLYVTCDAALQKPDWLPWPLTRTSAELLPRNDSAAVAQRDEAQGEEGRGMVKGRCTPLLEYANSKLALLSHSYELNQNYAFRKAALISHVLNPGPIDSPFGRGESAPTAPPSTRMRFMQYFPPVWIARKIYSLCFEGIGNFALRDKSVGAKAAFHVLTAPTLGPEEDFGGGLFSDQAGAFTACGKEPGLCGRVPISQQPPVAADREFHGTLWKATEEAIGKDYLEPLNSPLK